MNAVLISKCIIIFIVILLIALNTYILKTSNLIPRPKDLPFQAWE